MCMYIDIPYGRKFLPILPPALISEIFSCITYCRADMVTFTALVKILSLKNYYNTKIAGLGKLFKFQVYSR